MSLLKQSSISGIIIILEYQDKKYIMFGGTGAMWTKEIEKRLMNIVYPNLQINLSESGVREDYCIKNFIDLTVVSVIWLNGIQKG